MKSVDIASIRLTASARDRTFLLDMASPALASIHSSGSGQLSPVAAVSLRGEAERTLANIPPSACHAVWAYPLAGTAAAALHASSPELAFACLGGFVYFDRNMSLCGASALYEGWGLFFNPPHPAPLALIPRLRRAGRMHPTTRGALDKRGIRSFGWVAPAERVGSLPVLNGRLWPHGAFVYDYTDPERDSFFAVVQPPADSDAATEPASPLLMLADPDEMTPGWVDVFRALGVRKSDLRDPISARVIAETLGRMLSAEDVEKLGELPGVTGVHTTASTAIRAHRWATRAARTPSDPNLNPTPHAPPPAAPPPIVGESAGRPPPPPLPPPPPPPFRAVGPGAGGSPMDALKEQIARGMRLRAAGSDERRVGDSAGMGGVLAAIANGQARQGLRKVGARPGAKPAPPPNPMLVELEQKLARIRQANRPERELEEDDWSD